MNRAELYDRGVALLGIFCNRNRIPYPAIEPIARDDWYFDACAFYRPDKVSICIDKCANIGTAGRQWSYPGYTVDRTPYGVLQHELGHHVDVLNSERRGPYWGDFSVGIRKEAGEEQISSYCPNDGEWFAEMFRVFVTNPDLLRIIRPRTYAILVRRFEPVFADSWADRLNDRSLFPNGEYAARIVAAAQNKVLKAAS